MVIGVSQDQFAQNERKYGCPPFSEVSFCPIVHIVSHQLREKADPMKWVGSIINHENLSTFPTR